MAPIVWLRVNNIWSYVYKCFCALASNSDLWKSIIDVNQKAVVFPPPTCRDTSSTLSA